MKDIIPKIIKKLHYCFVPEKTGEKMRCTGSSDKSNIGSSIELVDFRAYLVNDSDHDIISIDRSGKDLKAKTCREVGFFFSWDFDWSNTIEHTLWINNKDAITFYKNIPLYGIPDKESLVDLPILNVKGYDMGGHFKRKPETPERLNEKRTLKAGKREGPFKKYYKSGELQEEGTYKAGKLHGLHKEYKCDGKLWIERTYKNGKLDGPLRTYGFPDEKLETETIYKNGKAQNPCKIFHPNGNLFKEMPAGNEMIAVKDSDGDLYMARKVEGPFKEYYESGQLEVEGTYKRNKVEGLMKIYYKSGKLKEERLYKDDEKEGPYKIYYESGQLKEEGTFKGDKKHGRVRIYGPQGSLMYVDTYKKGKKIDRKEKRSEE